MEVILRQYVENVGRRGEIVKVADGYARNYLLPRKLAFPVTPGNLKHVERERTRVEAHEDKERRAAEAVAATLKGIAVVVVRRVGETDALYGSVTAADIVEGLAAQQVNVDKRKLQLPDPIKRIGEYDVPVKLYRDVIAPVKVRVVAPGTPEPAAAAPAGDAAAEPAEAAGESETDAPEPAAG